MEKSHVVITTGGACKNNPGPGGYGAVLRFGEHRKTVCGYDPQTTNNRMEIKAVIEALKVLNRPCDVTIHTDSQYICNGIACAKEREANGWHTKTGARCVNTDLWKELTEIKRNGQHTIRYQYVDGAETHECNKLAKAQIKQETQE